MEKVSVLSLFEYQTVSQQIFHKVVYKDLPYEVIKYISKFLDIESKYTKIIETSIRSNIDNLHCDKLLNIINLKKINNIRYINKFFESVNNKLPFGGIFIGRVETANQRKKRILQKKTRIISYLYYSTDFVIRRVFPKINITKRIYFLLTRGQNRVLTLSEILGRLVCCGFEIIDYYEINGLLYYVVRKIKKPAFDMNPSFGPLFKMKRIGKNGKIIHVYKLRTMHPYAEYLQEYIYSQNNLQEGGKFKDDFRITTWGKIFRKLWLDELPMFINWFKGDLKLVGVRPLSKHYLSLYRPELRIKRIKYKPGLIPPFYADMPKTLEEIMDSEEKYLDAYGNNPFLTDIKYFFKALNNILIKRARSA